MSFFVYLFCFFFGVIIGSFLNVVILRYNTGLSLNGRSGCLSCGKNLTWKELVPVLSFLFQKGRCRGCQSKISWQYPIVELSTGLVFMLSAWFFRDPFSVILSWIMFSLLIVITVYDFKHKIIPDAFVYTFIFLGLLKPFLEFLARTSFSPFEPFIQALIGGALVSLPFLILWLLSRGRWLGFGDIKLALGIGVWLGVFKGFSAVILSVWLGAIVGLLLIAVSKLRLFRRRRRYTIKSELPFAPFLILGFFLHLIFSFNVFSLWQL